MKLGDTRRLSTVGGRNVGDSHRQEGWAQTGAGPSQRWSTPGENLSDHDGEEQPADPLGESPIRHLADIS
jgi:hypothetical protein